MSDKAEEEKFETENMIGIKEIHALECFKREIPPAKMVTDEERDIWDIKGLNFNMKAVSRTSPYLETYINNCKQQFEENLEAMKGNIKEVNNRIEDCVRTACETFKFTLKDSENTIENWKTLISSGKLPLTNVMMAKHDILNLNALHDILEKRRNAIEEFYNNLVSIENHRVKENVSILRNVKDALIKLAVKKPSEVREILETEILKINQIAINNVRYYEDMKLNFHLQGEKMKISFRDHVEKCQKKFAEKLLDTIQGQIQELDPDREFFNSDEGKKALESLYSAREVISNLIQQEFGHVRYSTDDVEGWAVKIQKATEDLDKITKMVIALYKKITYSLFQGRITELQKFQEEYLGMNELKSSENSSIMMELKKKIFTPVMEKEQLHEENVSAIETEWRNLMSDMQSTLQATFSFLYDSSKMWERHFSRTKEAKTMINMKLISLIAQHSVTEAEMEKEINIAIDSLRQEPTDEKLKYTLHKVYGLLGEIEDQYAKHFGEQQSIIERYSNISEAEIKLLQSEIEEFLNIYPNEYFNDYFLRRQDQLFTNTSGQRLDDRDKDEPESTNLPHELRKCHYQTDALRNWKLGLREAILFYQIVCNKELERNMKRWVDKQLNSFTRSFEAKLTVHRSRFQRVKTEIHDLRLAELESHIQRFESHVLGVQQQTYELTENLQNYFRDITATIIPEFTCSVKDIEDKAKLSDTSTDVSSLIVKAENTYSQYNYILNTRLQDFLTEAANKINWIEKTNLNFIKSLKLFSKGGNFHPEEAHVITGELDKLSDDVERKGAALRKQAIEKDSSTVRTVKVVSEKLLHGLRSTYEDIHFAEKVTLAIMRVRDFIKKEVKHMKYNRKLLTTKIDEMLTIMPETGGKDILNFITESWYPLLDVAEEHYNLLVQPLPTNENSKLAGLRFYGFDGIAMGVSRKQNVAKAHQSPGGPVNRMYVEMLFDNVDPPVAGNSFLEKVCNCMWEVFLPLQEAAADFYKARRGTPVNKMDVVKHNFNDFIEETLIRFKYYHLQCEEAWLEEVNGEQSAVLDVVTATCHLFRLMQYITRKFGLLISPTEYLSLLQRIKQMCNAFAEQSITKFHSNRMDAVSAAYNLFAKKMEELDRQHIDMRTVLSKKLKPHHGYPGNTLLLKELTQEIKKANNSMDNETEAHVDQYKQFMEERIEAYKTDSDGFRIVLDKLLESLFVSTRLNLNLTGQVDEVIQGINARTFLPPAVKKVGKRTKSLESRSSRNLKDQKLKQKRESAKKASTPALIESFEVPKVPPVFRLSIDKSEKIEEIVKKQIKNIRTTTSVDGQFEEKNIDAPEYASMEGECEESDMLPCNVAALLSMSEEEFEDYVAKCNLMASKYVTSCKEEGKIWFKLFKKHAAKVKELYTVRYD